MPKRQAVKLTLSEYQELAQGADEHLVEFADRLGMDADVLRTHFGSVADSLSGPRDEIDDDDLKLAAIALKAIVPCIYCADWRKQNPVPFE